MKKLKFMLGQSLFLTNSNAKQVHVNLPKRMTGPEALKASIQKWEFLVKALMNRKPEQVISCGGSNTCGLCHIFQHTPALESCSMCPVKLKSGQTYCEKTPFQKFETATNDLRNCLYHGRPLREEWISKQLEAAKEELKFLKNLKVK